MCPEGLCRPAFFKAFLFAFSDECFKKEKSQLTARLDCSTNSHFINMPMGLVPFNFWLKVSFWAISFEYGIQDIYNFLAIFCALTKNRSKKERSIVSPG